MITDKEIARINELYHKSKEGGGLTPEEKEEQAKLRGQYIASIRESMRANLERIDIEQEDGSVVSVKDRRKVNVKLIQ